MDEVEIARWIVEAKHHLENKVSNHPNPYYHLLPDSLYDIYVENYSDKVLEIIKLEIQQVFNLNPEEINSIITKDWICLLIGSEIFYPR